MITVLETSEKDLTSVQQLWADGDVMKYVGFPDGLQQTDEDMAQWYKWVQSSRPRLNHYSVFEDGIYCGETFYEIDERRDNSAALDIKLFPFARGRGIATKALSFAIEEAFRHGASKVWVDPKPLNEKAIRLYERLGFDRRAMPKDLQESEGYSSIYMEKLP
ncbi:MAG: GNAT family N-acetyltransferase [Faecousia sp.]